MDSSATNYPVLQSNSLSDQLQFALQVIESEGLENWGPCEDKDANVTAFVKAPWRNDTDDFKPRTLPTLKNTYERVLL